MLGFWHRHWQLRAQLLVATVAGVLAGRAASALGADGGAQQWLLGWDVGVLVYLALVARLAQRATPAMMRHRARLADNGRPAILALVLACVGASLVAVVVTLRHARAQHHGAGALDVALVLATVALSWLMLHTVFALHYAHVYYGDDDGPGGAEERGGLKFPGGGAPDYWDFVYMACIVGAAAQTADVAYTSRRMRRLGTLHAVLAFGFNTGVLALMVNVAAGLL